MLTSFLQIVEDIRPRSGGQLGRNHAGSTLVYTKELLMHMCEHAERRSRSQEVPPANAQPQPEGMLEEEEVIDQSTPPPAPLFRRTKLSGVKRPAASPSTVGSAAQSSTPAARAATVHDRFAADLQHYLDMKPIYSDDWDKPLQFWKKRAVVMPVLSEVAVQVLSVLPSSAESERVFSFLGDLCDKKRARVTSAKINQIVFIKRNTPFLEAFRSNAPPPSAEQL